MGRKPNRIASAPVYAVRPGKTTTTEHTACATKLARVMDASTRSVVFETLGASDKIESFVADMVEISRAEIVAVARGLEAT